MVFRLNPDYAQNRKAWRFVGKHVAWALLLFWALWFWLAPFCVALAPDILKDMTAGKLIGAFFHNPFMAFNVYGTWLVEFITQEPLHFTWTSFFGWRLPLLPACIAGFYVAYHVIMNPFEYGPQYYGSAHEARLSEVKKMGLFEGKYLYIGEYKNGAPMRLTEPRSVFCIGAPLSGKTAGVVIPNVLYNDNACVFVYDPTGEIAKATSGYRATLGPTFQMDFSKIDQPEKNIYYPCWNPLGKGNLPPAGSTRETYIDSLVQFLIPDGPSGSDPYWVRTGRGALCGLTIFIVSKVEQALANDYFIDRITHNLLDEEDKEVLLSYYLGMQPIPEVKKAIEKLQNGTFTPDDYVAVGSWEHLPQTWVGKEASFGMLLDLLNNWMFQESVALRQKIQAGDEAAVMADVWQNILECLVNETFYYGYSRRALLEINQVFALPDKQRSSVISMAERGLNPFKNLAIRNRTASTDISYNDLRGIKNPKTGKYEPITVYINREGGDVCSLFINMVSAYLMSAGPNEQGSGPFPVDFILDNFELMPKLQSITDGITFGRSKYNIFLVCVKDWHQISAVYGDITTDIILSSVGCKIIKRHNNPQTRQKMLAGLGNWSHRVSKKSKINVGFGKKVKPFMHLTGGREYMKDSVVGGTGVLGLAADKQWDLLTGYAHRPLRANSPFFFKHSKMKVKSSIPPAPPVPESMVQRKLAEQNEALAKIQLG